MITIKSKHEIEGMKKSGEILSKIHIGLRDITWYYNFRNK